MFKAAELKICNLNLLGGDTNGGPTKFGIKLFSERWVDHSDRDKRARARFDWMTISSFCRLRKRSDNQHLSRAAKPHPSTDNDKVFMLWLQHFVCINIFVLS